MKPFRPLTAADIEVRVGTASEKGCSLLLYKDARCDMRILDETVGPENWQCGFYEHKGTLFCRVGIKCEDEWIWKDDAGAPSNMEPAKGEASDAFKRACFKWGIGRELYTSPFIWVPADKCSIVPGRNGKPTCYDKFEVTELEIGGAGQIVSLAIKNAKRGQEVFRMGVSSPQTKTAPQNGSQQPKNRFAKVSDLKNQAISLGISEQGIKEWMNANVGTDMRTFTDAQIHQVEMHLEQLIEDRLSLS